MITKKKKCKVGIFKAKGFQGCMTEQYVYKYGLCKSCFFSWLKTDEGIKHAQSLIPKAKKEIKKQRYKKTKEKKESLKTISQLKEEVQQLFNKLIRLIDSDYNCISCGNKASEAGHYYTKGGHDNIRFNAHNVHSQCHVCNCRKGGNESEYVNGLIERYGFDYFEKVRTLKGLNSKKILRSDIPELKIKIRELIKRVENGEEITRDYINSYLGVNE